MCRWEARISTLVCSRLQKWSFCCLSLWLSQLLRFSDQQSRRPTAGAGTRQAFDVSKVERQLGRPFRWSKQHRRVSVERPETK